MIYNGLWFSAFHQDLFAFVASNQRFVSGRCASSCSRARPRSSAGRASTAFTSKKLATYENGDSSITTAAKGFIRLHGLEPADAGPAAIAQGWPWLRPAGLARQGRIRTAHG